MTTVLGPETDERDDRLSAAAAALAEGVPDNSAADAFDVEEGDTPPQVSLRPVLAAGLSASGAALVIGGIYGSWAARIFGLFVAVAGAGLAAWALRSRRPALAQGVIPLCFLGFASISVLPSSPGDLSQLVRDAVDAGRLLRPPVPFDPGWRPLLVLVLGFLSFGAAWVGSAGGKPVLGVAIPIPLTALAAITQPEQEQVLAGVFAVMSILAA